MSSTLAQIFALNPASTVNATDYFYLVQSPYTSGTDAAITGANLKAAMIANITSLGTVTTGTWNATTIAPTVGGTGLTTYVLGDMLYSSAANVLSRLAGSTVATKRFLTQTGTGTVSAAPSWGTIATADLPAAAMTAANDTNVTLTLGGTPATALLQATSLTMGWAGLLAVGRGGTGAATFNTNGIVVSGATTTTALASLSLSDGQIVIGSSTGAPLAASITAGSGISVTPGHNTITIASTVAGILSWVDQATSAVTMAINTGYVCNNGASLITFTLPTTAAEGSVIEIAGNSAGGWTVAQGSGQSIKLGSQTSTVGVGGSISSSNAGDCVRLLCVIANSTFRALSGWGNITYV